MSGIKQKNAKYILQQFHFKKEPKADPKAIVKTKYARFTILTPKLIRLEYDHKGEFEDRATQAIWFRKQPVPNFSTREENGQLIIQTKYLQLKYKIDSKFTSKTLSIERLILKNIDSEKNSLKIKTKSSNKRIIWKYGMKDRHNLKGTYRTLDHTNGKVRLKNGLISKEGWAILDDSKSLVFNEYDWPQPRTKENLTKKIPTEEIQSNDYKKNKKDEYVDIYFFGYGTDYIGLLRDFYKISGKTPLIPRYILGNWWSRYWEYDEKELKELIENFEKYKIPMSVCIIDMDWHLVNIDKKYGKGWTGYTWNRDLFPDPKRMLEWLHEKKLKIALNLHPAQGIRAYEECYPKVAEFMGIDPKSEKAVEFDITDPKFVKAYFELVHHPLEEEGVDFWWIDWQQGKKSKIPGLDPLWMLNHLHFLDLGRERKNGEKLRPFIFSRWGNQGNHRYPIGFSGDTFTSWKTLNFQPYFTVTASNIGYGWWSHDIGGHYWGIENPELYLRWVQFGIFSPIFRLHSTKKRYCRREPWRYEEQILNSAREMMKLRHRLVPYIYTMAYKNFIDGIPLMRPLYYFHPYKDEVYKYKNEYWFGSELIVCPITKPIDTKIKRVYHEFYLPPGDYFDFFNDEYTQGNKILKRLYRIQEIPVFAKAGAIIPLAFNPNKIPNGTPNPDEFWIEIFPGNDNVFNLYEDDGISTNYLNSNYKKGEEQFSKIHQYFTEFKLNWGINTKETNTYFEINFQEELPNFIPKRRTFTLRFHAIDSTLDESNIVCEFQYFNSEKTEPIKNNQIEFRKIEDEYKNKGIPMVGLLHRGKENFHTAFGIVIRIKDVDLERVKKIKIKLNGVAIIKANYTKQRVFSMIDEAPVSTGIKWTVERLFLPDGDDSKISSETVEKIIKRIKRFPKFLIPGYL